MVSVRVRERLLPTTQVQNVAALENEGLIEVYKTGLPPLTVVLWHFLYQSRERMINQICHPR